jgi:hypothetical protein
MFARVMLGAMMIAVFLAPEAVVHAMDGDDQKAASGKREKFEPVEELPANASANEKLLDLVSSGFRIESTPHYVIATDAAPDTLKKFIHRLEVTYKSCVKFADKMGVEIKEPAEKLHIIFFDTLEGYVQYGRSQGAPADENVPGFYSQTTNRSAFFNYDNAPSMVNRLDDLSRARASIRIGSNDDPNLGTQLRAAELKIEQLQERVNRTVVQHEVAHQVLFNIGFHARGSRNPRWFTEGTAMMFETPPGRGGAGIGAINQYRLGEWRHLKDGEQLIATRTLVGDPTVIIPPHPDVSKAYCQSWSLVHYLQRYKRKDLAGFVNEIRDRKEDRIYSADEEMALFEKHFGALDERFNQKYLKAIERLPYRQE